MKRSTMDIVACPACHNELTLTGAPSSTIQTGSLGCPRCGHDYPIAAGIPHFIQPEELNGFNRRFSRVYDWFSWGYRAFSKIAFAYIGMDE